MYEIQESSYISNLIYSGMSSQIASMPYQILQNDELTGISSAESTLRAILSENKEDQESVDAGISQLQTTDYAVDAISEKLDRMKEIATEVEAGGLTQEEIDDRQTEFEQLMNEINDIAITTSPGGNEYLLNTEGGTVSISIGDGLSIDVDTTVMTTSGLGINENMDLSSDPAAVLAGVEAAISKVSDYSTYLEGKVDTLKITAQSLDAQRDNIVAAQSIVDSIETALDMVSSIGSALEPLAEMLLMTQANLNAEAISDLLNYTEDEA